MTTYEFKKEIRAIGPIATRKFGYILVNPGVGGLERSRKYDNGVWTYTWQLGPLVYRHRITEFELESALFDIDGAMDLIADLNLLLEMGHIGLDDD